MPDICFPSEASVIRLEFPVFHVNTYIPPSQANVACPPLVAAAVPSGLTTTSRLFDHFQVPTIRPQPLSDTLAAEFADFDLDRGGAGVSLPPETDLFSKPMVPPVEPACEKAGLCIPHVNMMIDSATPKRCLRRAIMSSSEFNARTGAGTLKDYG
jgi:hypothetical protein